MKQIGTSVDRLRAVLDALGSKQCVCGHRKNARQSFCRECYHRLPWDLKAALWKHVTEGYVGHYEAAKDWLEKNPAEEPQASKTTKSALPGLFDF
jgi:hypothetical protein